MNLRKAGLFACGTALGPCFMDEAIVQGRAAALQAAAYLRRTSVGVTSAAAGVVVDECLCSGCELCVRVCPFEARSMDQKTRVAIVDEGRCTGCGTCAMVCPNGATQQRLFEAPAMLAMIDEAVR
jgi:heterodisulfide reductase subunit A2